MTIEQLREKIAYRTNKMNWCISVGRETQAQWNREQIARLEENIQAMEAQEVIEVNSVRSEPLMSSLARNEVTRHEVARHEFVRLSLTRNEVTRNEVTRDTDEDFDYV